VLEDAEPGVLERYTVRSVIAPSDELLGQLAGRTGSTDGAALTREFSSFGQVRRLARDVLAGAGVATAPPPDTDPEARWSWNVHAATALAQYL
ncbi:MAG: hypothetical protein GTO74_12520, partial [Hydrogenophaga sp.]|uniref:hypothetical protein n=1 Tax=Hydrogenophaga sp. TaxID=1904254 RepID=UPI0016972010